MNTDDDTRLEQLADETALKSSGVMLVYRAPIILAALHKAVEPYRKQAWPDIGPDPLANRDTVDQSTDAARARLQHACDIQQKEVPDQTALVWRIDINRVTGDLVWRTAQATSFQSQIEKLKSENAALMKQVGDLKVELASAQDRYEEAERNTAAWNNSFHAANTDRLQLQAENDHLKQQIDELSCKAALRRQEAPMDRKE